MKILIPKQPRTDQFSHPNDAFRSMIYCWKKNGLVDVEEIDHPYVWVDEIGDILLYDFPICNKKWLLPFIQYRIGLFAHQVPQPLYEKNSNWISWAKCPEMVEELSKKEIQWSERTIETVFIGNVDSQEEQQFSLLEWKENIDFFSLTTKKENQYTQQEYLEKIQQSRFGLCLRGKNTKSHRVVEYMALGVVPIITDNICLSYFTPLEENVHYIRVSDPSDLKSKISTIGEKLWAFMSNSCKDFYKKHFSIQGSFETTKTIISMVELRNKKKKQVEWKTDKLHSICSFAIGNTWRDFEIFLHSYLETHKNIPLYLMLDDEIEQRLEPFESKLKIVKKNCLNQYSKFDRKDMEKRDIFKNFSKIKADLVSWVLEKEANTLYANRDIVFLYRMDSYIDFSKDVGLSCYRTNSNHTEQHGFYDSSFVFIQNKSFPQWCRKQTNSKFLDSVPMTFSFFEFHDSCNFEWHRMFQSEEHFQKIQSEFTIKNNKIMYKGCPLNSIRTNFYMDEPAPILFQFNSFLCSLLENVTSYQFYHSLLKLKQKFIMIQQYYNDKDDARQKELDFCVQSNLNSLFVKKLILWNEKGTIVPDKFLQNEKLEIITNKNWINFQDIIEFTNSNYPNDIIILSNLDIFIEFNYTFQDVLKCLKEYSNIIFCNSRIELGENGLISLNRNMDEIGYGNCQDSWIFKGDVCLPNCDIPLGYLGCESAFAFQCQNNQVTPINLGMYLPFLHFDNYRGKSLANQKDFHKDKIYHCQDYFLVPTMKFLINEPFNLSKKNYYFERCLEYNQHVKLKN